MRVLVVEDDQRLARVISRLLGQERIDVEIASDGLTGADLALTGKFDVAIVDRMLPGMDGLSLVREMRNEEIATPVLMLTALSDLPERVQGLNAGADDYLGKPFAFEELLARVRALARRGERPVSGETIVIGNLRINPYSHEVTVNEQPVELTPQEFRVLDVLVRNRGRILSRDQLLERAWGSDADPAGNVVDLYIFYLRKKLRLNEQLPGLPRIVTVRGRGYMLREPD